LPEALGGVRNWDYRYCWLRDATVTLRALVTAGFHEEAAAWQHWLLRATAGDPSQAQILYGVAGEHRVPESTLDWLPGYAGSAPVRIGNAAVEQFQLDVYGEVLGALHHARMSGVLIPDDAWDIQVRLLDHVSKVWREPDEGLWEVRVGRRQFVHSKVMCWAAFDSSIRSAEEFGLPAPLDEWRATRDRIHADVCARGYDEELGAFTQYYGSRTVDAAALLIPLSGFLPADDPRVESTVRVIERELMRDGLLARYRTLDGAVDGLPGEEGAFVPCTLWLAGVYALRDDYHRAAELYERVLALRGDFGLLAEEVDPRTGRHLGNTPQAYSHVATVLAAHLLEDARVRQLDELRAARAGRARRLPQPAWESIAA
jgi:GH15 family glucan-1,4-alpha-glucosidase